MNLRKTTLIFFIVVIVVFVFLFLFKYLPEKRRMKELDNEALKTQVSQLAEKEKIAKVELEKVKEENKTLREALAKPKKTEKPKTIIKRVKEIVYVPAEPVEIETEPEATTTDIRRVKPATRVVARERYTESIEIDEGSESEATLPRIEDARRVEIKYKEKPRLAGLVEYKFSANRINGMLTYDVKRFILGVSMDTEGKFGILGGYRIK